MKALSSTTFVAEVTAPALAVLVPLLTRALNDRSMEVQRRTVVVVDNLVKLVRDPSVAAAYLSGLVDGVEKIMTSASFPEVRALQIKARYEPGLPLAGSCFRGGGLQHSHQSWRIQKRTSTCTTRFCLRMRFRKNVSGFAASKRANQLSEWHAYSATPPSRHIHELPS